jgi:hypothetical protein
MHASIHCQKLDIYSIYFFSHRIVFNTVKKMVANKTFHQIINILFLTCWLIITVLSLTTLIIIIRHWRRQCRSVVNLLTANQCVALLVYVVTSFIQTPSVMQRICFEAPEPNPLVCRVYACLAIFGNGVITSSCVVQAMSRFFITILYKYRILLTYRTNWIMIISVWIGSGLFSSILLFVPRAYQYEPESLFCTLTTHNFETSFIGSVIILVSLLILMTTLYGMILYHTARHTRINPNGANTLRARRNKKVFQNVFLFVGIFALGMALYSICSILNRVGEVPWPLYSISVLFIALASVINSIALLATNEQLKGILMSRPINAPYTVRTVKTNQTAPYSIKTKTIQPLSTVA